MIYTLAPCEHGCCCVLLVHQLRCFHMLLCAPAVCAALFQG